MFHKISDEKNQKFNQKKKEKNLLIYIIIVFIFTFIRDRKVAGSAALISCHTMPEPISKIEYKACRIEDAFYEIKFIKKIKTQ